MSNMYELFADSEEYPFTDGLPLDILPMDTLWCYVSSSFLNGMVNSSGKLIACAIGNTYHQMDEVFDARTEILNPPGSMEWGEVVYSTKRDIISLFEKGYRQFHTKLYIFNDNVYLLFKSGTEFAGRPVYVYFEYDCDVSDCNIGRFYTITGTDETVIELFKNATPDQYNVPVDWLSGWISF